MLSGWSPFPTRHSNPIGKSVHAMKTHAMIIFLANPRFISAFFLPLILLGSSRGLAMLRVNAYRPLAFAEGPLYCIFNKHEFNAKRENAKAITNTKDPIVCEVSGQLALEPSSGTGLRTEVPVRRLGLFPYESLERSCFKVKGMPRATRIRAFHGLKTFCTTLPQKELFFGKRPLDKTVVEVEFVSATRPPSPHSSRPPRLERSATN